MNEDPRSVCGLIVLTAMGAGAIGCILGVGLADSARTLKKMYEWRVNKYAGICVEDYRGMKSYFYKDEKGNYSLIDSLDQFALHPETTDLTTKLQSAEHK